LNAGFKKDDLANLIASKRSSIQNMRQSYRYHREKLDSSGRVIAHEDSRVTKIFIGDKCLIDRNCESKGFDQQPSNQTVCQSYDGHVVRTVISESNDQPQAMIDILRSRSAFFEPHELLSAAMLEDSKTTRGRSLPLFDLAEMLAITGVLVLEDTEDVEGSKCLVMTDGLFRVYLDKARDFSVVRIELWDRIEDPKGSKDLYRGREVTKRRDLKELEDYGNGIWLPKKVECVSYEHGIPVERETTIVESIEINKGVDDKVFTDIIPKNAIVMDGIGKSVYRYGSRASVEGMRSETTKTKSQWKIGFIWLNVIALIVLVCIFVLRKWYKFRRNKGRA
jgi:hypothetical protein